MPWTGRARAATSTGPTVTYPRTIDRYSRRRKIVDGSPAYEAAAGIAEGLAAG
ncbi:hypothetical protein [Streptomyces sp. ok210]|jgi:hypothetical protein|uniref:hypothetical protein n=1 Tax=Streptomyces sp. ok210 TaxID=1761905 RepID=UPI0008ED1A20|nr:hypothetical protein [Streptomyces sp. ok210]SFT21408.1 hypothetical protein SAMN04487982_11076 [Streptomyces sp. ok210]